MTDVTITKTQFFKASRETVWQFLTDKDKLAEWFHPAESDLASGADYALYVQRDDGARDRQCWGTVTHWDPPKKLVYSFTVKPLQGAMTTVTWLLEEAGEGTKLTLHHSGLDGRGEAFGLVLALDAGWDEHLLALRSAAK